MAKIKQWFNFIRIRLAKGFKRFPLTIGFAVAFVVAAIYFNHATEKTYIDQILMALAIGVPLSAAMKMMAEHFLLRKGIDITVTVIFVAVYGYLIPNSPDDLFVRQYMALSAALYGIFFIIPYLKRPMAFSQYLFYNVGKFFLTLLYALILFAGTSAVYFTVDVLFELNLSGEVYMDLMLIAFGIFGPMHFLGHLPKPDQRDLPYTMLFKRLFAWIVLPLLTVYTFILHAYFIKILLTRAFPEGMIGNLVVWYGLISIVTLFFLNEMAPEQLWLSKLIKYYPLGMAAPLGMLFVAAGMRIGLYGLTLSRYLLVVAGLYETIAVSLLFLKRDRANVPIGILAVAVVILAFHGPVSGDSLTKWQQNALLRSKIDAFGAVNAQGDIAIDALDAASQNEINLTASYLADHYGVDSIYFAETGETAETFEVRTGISLKTYRYPLAKKESYFSHNDAALMSQVALGEADYLIRVSTYDPLDIVLYDDVIRLTKSSEADTEVLTLALQDDSATDNINLSEWTAAMVQADDYDAEKTVTLGQRVLKIRWIAYNLNGYVREATPIAADKAGTDAPDSSRAIQFFEGYLLIDTAY